VEHDVGCNCVDCWWSHDCHVVDEEGVPVDNNEPEVTGEETVVDEGGKEVEISPDAIGLNNLEEFIAAGGDPFTGAPL